MAGVGLAALGARAQAPVPKIAGFDQTDAPSHARLVIAGLKRGLHMATALNTTVSGVYAHMSAMKDGETLKIPQFAL